MHGKKERGFLLKIIWQSSKERYLAEFQRALFLDDFYRTAIGHSQIHKRLRHKNHNRFDNAASFLCRYRFRHPVFSDRRIGILSFRRII